MERVNFEPCAAEVMRRFARAAGGEVLEVGGGVAGFVASDSPVNAAKGMDGKVGATELKQVMEFFFDRRKDAVVELAPWVEAECMAELGELGFMRVAEEDVMAQRSVDGGVDLEECRDVEEWARLMCLSFFGNVNEQGMELGRAMFHAPDSLNLGIWENGDLVTGGGLTFLCGQGLMAGDATLEQFRGRGLQQKLIRGRMRRAHEAGCEWVHSEVLRASGSQRNYERCGFSPVYARAHYLRPYTGVSH